MTRRRTWRVTCHRTGRGAGRGARSGLRGLGGACQPRHATTTAAAVFVQLALRWGRNWAAQWHLAGAVGKRFRGYRGCRAKRLYVLSSSRTLTRAFKCRGCIYKEGDRANGLSLKSLPSTLISNDIQVHSELSEPRPAVPWAREPLHPRTCLFNRHCFWNIQGLLNQSLVLRA